MSNEYSFWPAVFTAPLVAIGTAVFWWKRSFFPLADRVPWIGCATGCVVLLLDFMYMTDTQTEMSATCSLQSLTITIICVPLGIYTFLSRSILLLFRFEISADLAKREKDLNQSSLIEPSVAYPHSLATYASHAAVTPHAGTGTTAVAGGGSSVGGGHHPHQGSLHHHTHTLTQTFSPTTATTGAPDDNKQLIGHAALSPGAINHVTSPTATSPIAWRASLNSSPHYNAPASAPASPRSHIGPHQGNSTAPHGMAAYSWYTRHNYLVSRRYIIGWNAGITGICAAIWILVVAFQSNCDDSYGLTAFALYGSICISIIEGLILLVLGRKLSRHGQDSLGLKVEIRVTAISVIITALVGFPLIVALSAQNWWGVILILIGFIQWITSVCYPLWLMRSHNQQQDELANEVERFSSLADFLRHDACYEAYAQFVAAELSGGGLAFYIRCRSYKALHQKKANKTKSGTIGGHHHHMSSAVHGDHHLIGGASSADVDRIILLSQSNTTTNNNNMTAKGKSTPLQRALKEAVQIQRSFILANAPFEINISAAAKTRIATHVKAMTTAVAVAQRAHQNSMTNDAMTLADQADQMLLTNILATFDEAIEEMLRLLTQNSFSRFKMSMSYRQLIANLHHHTHPRGHGAPSRQASFRDGHITSRTVVTNPASGANNDSSPHGAGGATSPPMMSSSQSHRHLLSGHATSPTSPPSDPPSTTRVAAAAPPPPMASSASSSHTLKRAMSTSSPAHVWTKTTPTLTVGMLKPSVSPAISGIGSGSGGNNTSTGTRAPSRSSSASTRSTRGVGGGTSGGHVPSSSLLVNPINIPPPTPH